MMIKRVTCSLIFMIFGFCAFADDSASPEIQETAWG